jgi:hypothetical protein
VRWVNFFPGERLSVPLNDPVRPHTKLFWVDAIDDELGVEHVCPRTSSLAAGDRYDEALRRLLQFFPDETRRNSEFFLGTIWSVINIWIDTHKSGPSEKKTPWVLETIKNPNFICL